MSVIACTKSNDSAKKEHIKNYYRVAAVKGTDTVRTPARNARTETVGIAVVEDSKLKMTLTAYYNGTYVIEVKNKQECSVVLDWGWEGLRIFDIDPNYNILSGGETKTYTLHGEAKLGKIKLKSYGWCGNSSTLVLNITMAILPVTFLEFDADYKDGNVLLSFLIDDPKEVDTFIIEKLVGTEWIIVFQFTCDKKTTSYNIPIFDDEAH